MSLVSWAGTSLWETSTRVRSCPIELGFRPEVPAPQNPRSSYPILTPPPRLGSLARLRQALSPVSLPLVFTLSSC